MAKYSFHDDYSEGAHRKIIEALAKTKQQSGYGDDDYSELARKAIRTLIGTDEAKIYFAPGGTSANLLAIASHLRPHESVIAAVGGHIVEKEGGAIESTGHQVITVPGVEAKLPPAMIQSAFDRSFEFAYQPRPGMVFISNSTEIGTVYTKSELEAVATVCKRLKLLLFMDGARFSIVVEFVIRNKIFSFMEQSRDLHN